MPSITTGLLVTVLAVLLWGCASTAKNPPTNVEKTAEAWKVMEKQSQGHSPRGQFMLAEPPTIIDTPAKKAEHAGPAPTLPTTVMSLRMHNADVSAVLQALARAAGRSLVLAPGVTGTVNVNIVQRPWDEIFTGILGANRLTYSFDGQTIRVMSASDLQGMLEMETIRRKTVAERQAALKEEPLTTSVASIRFADAKQLQKTIESSLSRDKDGKPVGQIHVDELTNSLIIQSVEPDIAKVTRLLAKLDAPRSQIKLKAHIVETTKETARYLGILWGGWYKGKVGGGNNSNLYLSPGGSSSAATTSTVTSPAVYEPLLGTGVSGTGTGVNLSNSNITSTGASMSLMVGNLAGNVLETQLQALQNDNKLNIISSPSISTMDNQKAFTEAGERVPYQTISGTGTSATTSVEFQDALLRLEITPHIIDDQFIKLAVMIQKDEVDTSRTVSGNPYIVKKKTETTLIARNGETVVISGLSKLRNQLNEAGIPGLKDVPGLGWLGKNHTKVDLKDEFMIFITPQVLADWREGEKQKQFEEIERELSEAEKKRETAGAEDNATVRVKSMPTERALPEEKPAPRSAVTIKEMPTAKADTWTNPDGAPTADDAPLDEAALYRARAAKPALGGRQ